MSEPSQEPAPPVTVRVDSAEAEPVQVVVNEDLSDSVIASGSDQQMRGRR